MARFSILVSWLLGNAISLAAAPATIGSHRELLVDDWLV
jgi:hypothetical protein